MIEDVLIRKFVAEHHRCTRANSNPAFSTVIVCTIALVDTQSTNLDASRVTNAVMLLTNSLKQFRLR